MANVKISGLPAASSVVGTNEFEINEAGTSKKVTGSQIASYVNSLVSTDTISEGNSSVEVIDTGTDGRVVVTTEGTERMRITADGNVEIGSSEFRFELSRLASDYDTPTLRLKQQRGMLIKEFGIEDRPGGLWLYGQTNDNIGSQGAIGAGYVGDLGTMRALATSGSSIYFDQGDIRFFADTGYTVGTNVGLTERMRIHASGGVSIGNTTDNGAGNLSVNGQIQRLFTDVGTNTAAQALATNHVSQVTISANTTLTTTVPPAGTTARVIIITSGTTSRTVTFGTGFRTTGTLATGTADSRRFVITFISDGTQLLECSRTAAITV